MFLVDTKGLITESRGDDKPEHKKVFMRTDDTPDMKVRHLPYTGSAHARIHLPSSNVSHFSTVKVDLSSSSSSCSVPSVYQSQSG